MIQSLSSAVAGMQQFQTSMDVIGNNIANSNTTGYKSSRTQFADALSQTLQYSTPSTATAMGTAPVQIGMGVQTVAIQNEFRQGVINPTGVPSDLAISGDGFFTVKDPFAGTKYVTRAGDFQIDGNGYLLTANGMRVQGYNDSGLATVGDIQIDGNGSTSPTIPAPSYSSYGIDSTGKITVRMSDGSTFTRGQILLQGFRTPEALIKEGGNLYTGIDLAGPLGGAGSATPYAPGTNGLGSIQSSALETSNVDLTSEFANMITTQRGFQANAKVITTSDEILQDIINLKR